MLTIVSNKVELDFINTPFVAAVYQSAVSPEPTVTESLARDPAQMVTPFPVGVNGFDAIVAIYG